MATNYHFSRSSHMSDQYLREMESIEAALMEESLDEREERLSFVEHSWPLSCVCFQGQLEATETPVLSSVAVVRQ